MPATGYNLERRRTELIADNDFAALNRPVAKIAPVVVGENMTRVNSYARKIGGSTIDDRLAGRKWSQKLNDRFITMMKTQDREFIDIGPAFGRRQANRIDPILGRSPSTVYAGERQELLRYGNYRRVYEREGKYQGGVPGFDPP